ncbi:tetratricopeptide repeat protein [Saccharothrix sp. BKS2]|uniref:ATP-binding protein n=1 Tax=Saccharothrix sp. BKS2 TaxID=3064400 RepID=UPI0039ECC7CA
MGEPTGWTAVDAVVSRFRLWDLWWVTDGVGVSNSLAGTAVVGAVVQAGNIGQVVLPTSRVPVPRQLPAGVRDFTGRAGELAAVDSALGGSLDEPSGPSVVVLEGMGGVGKTSLAVRWARGAESRFPDGTLFADLRGYGPSAPLVSSAVLAGFLQGLGTSAEAVPAAEEAQVGLYRSLTASRRVLVVLDNAVSADQVRPLLPAGSGCVTVVTGRAALTGLAVSDGAVRLPVGVLPVEDAVSLVEGVIGEERARAEPEAVASLVSLCGGLPLALRVAACRIAGRRHGSVAGLVTGIAEERGRVEGLSVSGDDSTAVRAVFDASYARLSPEQARLFRLLGLHPTVELGEGAAAALSDWPLSRVRWLLEDLVDLNLVEQVGVGRYRLHDLAYAYAAGRADADDSGPDRRQAVTRVVGWYATVADEADRVAFPGDSPLALRGSARGVPEFDRPGALEWLTAELTTMLTALRTAHGEGLWSEAVLLAGACRFVTARPRSLWPLRLEAEALGLSAAREAGDQASELSLLIRRGNTRRQLERWAEAEADFTLVLKSAGDAGDDRVRRLDALCGLGYLHRTHHQYEQALACYTEALPLAQETGAMRTEAVVEANLGAILTFSGQPVEGLAHLERELVLRHAADPPNVAYALHGMAVARQHLGEHDRVLELCGQALPLCEQSGGMEYLIAPLYEAAATSHEHLGQPAQARQKLVEAVRVLTELGDPRVEEVLLRLHALEAGAAGSDQSVTGGAVGPG